MYQENCPVTTCQFMIIMRVAYRPIPFKKEKFCYSLFKDIKSFVKIIIELHQLN